MFSTGWRILQLKGWIVIKSHPIRVEDLVLGLKECENSHTLTATTTGSKNSQKEAVRKTSTLDWDDLLSPEIKMVLSTLVLSLS